MLNLTVYVACAGAFVFALMGMAGGKYAVLLELDDAVHSVVNLSPLATFLLGPCVFTATTWGMYRTMLRFTKAEVRLNFYVKATILLADALALTCWLLFCCLGLKCTKWTRARVGRAVQGLRSRVVVLEWRVNGRV